MIKVHLANILLICVLGTLLLWPELKIEPPIDESVRTAYQSVCQITSETQEGSASGVLLESGYVLTAAHVIDRNQDGKIDDHEKVVKLTFPSNEFETTATTLYCSDMREGLDIAILKPKDNIPLMGVKLMSAKEYWKLKIGTPVYTIGMQSGQPRANVTDGRIITTPKDKSHHRNSANSYYGNSGGGVFIGNKLVGIASQLGLGQHRLMVPIFSADHKRRVLMQVGTVSVPYQVPLANQSIHVSAPAVRDFVNTGKYDGEPLWERPVKCPYEDYYSVMGFNAALALFLLLVFKVMRRRWS